MTGKKIEFTRKPDIKDAGKFIDNWVSGKDQVIKDKKLKRTTIYLPADLHKKLKITAADTDTSMTDIIINTLKKYIG